MTVADGRDEDLRLGTLVQGERVDCLESWEGWTVEETGDGIIGFVTNKLFCELVVGGVYGILRKD